MKYHEYSFSWDENSKHTFSLKVLNWIHQFSTFIYLDSNHYPDPYGTYELLIAVNAYQTYHSFQECPAKTWIFGHYAFPSKKEGTTKHWPVLELFQPEIVIAIPRGSCQMTIYSIQEPPKEIYNKIIAQPPIELPSYSLQSSKLGDWVIPFEIYKNKIQHVKAKIEAGVCDELNLCIEYQWKEFIPEPHWLFYQMNQKNPCPFSFFYRRANQFALSTSPERFFNLRDQKLITQPIKGTVRRGITEDEDLKLKQQLLEDPKEQYENEVITKMIFNELSSLGMDVDVKILIEQELFTFPTLHHLISTLSADFNSPPELHEIFSVLFPMGSMTGMPKSEVLKLTHEVEPTDRGLYSGTVGYQSPSGNWDFNVVIRTLFYDSISEICSFHTGGAITPLTDAEREWNEIQLKASFLRVD